MIIIDKYFSFGYIDRKFDAFDKFIEFKAESDNQLGRQIKTLRLDRGNVSSRFQFFPYRV